MVGSLIEGDMVRRERQLVRHAHHCGLGGVDRRHSLTSLVVVVVVVVMVVVVVVPLSG